MPLLNYGVLKGKVVDTARGEGGKHYEVHLKGEEDVDYRIAINIKSGAKPSEVLYFVSEDFKSDDITILPTLEYGYTPITDNDIALDYIRGGLFDPKKMIPLPHSKPGEDNDLAEKIERYIHEAKEKNATIYAYGERWGPENNKPDRYFDFLPGNGIHDIHMNQGNLPEKPKWFEDDGIWQDGGVLIHFENENRWVGIFLAFQSQSWCTDEEGHRIKPVKECNHKNFNS
ncbi:YukJ family protein [Bacillus inaquosorum]|uniref:YukJ family protein n=1 Tax=Bacillus inaquosorum TaxID=483913 RepID=UPI00227DD598|nr:YukJ family protein [Bacillus inaquosorum]MCY8995780.1 YukJ family protein [Bacillus inaquosorum]